MNVMRKTNKKMRDVKKIFVLGFLLIFYTISLSGCASIPENTKIVLTTGLSDDEVFKINTSVCSKEEFMVYLTNLQNKYETIYGADIWSKEDTEDSLEEKIKDSVLTELEQIKTMNLMAQQYNITLSSEEEEMIQTAASQYMASLSDDEINVLGVSQSSIAQMYREYAIANDVYDTIIGGVNPEISDDEARIITVEQIGIKTYTTDSDGNRTDFTEEEKQKAYQEISEALQKAEAGEDFDSLISEYSDVSESTLSFGHGEEDEAYEEAAFNLATDEISDIVETDDGYYIIKCISTFNKDETDANKIKILETRKNEAFSTEYDSFNENVTKEVNQKLFDNISFVQEEQIDTSDFFSIFDDDFSQ